MRGWSGCLVLRLSGLRILGGLCFSIRLNIVVSLSRTWMHDDGNFNRARRSRIVELGLRFVHLIVQESRSFLNAFSLQAGGQTSVEAFTNLLRLSFRNYTALHGLTHFAGNVSNICVQSLMVFAERVINSFVC